MTVRHPRAFNVHQIEITFELWIYKDRIKGISQKNIIFDIFGGLKVSLFQLRIVKMQVKGQRALAIYSYS